MIELFNIYLGIGEHNVKGFQLIYLNNNVQSGSLLSAIWSDEYITFSFIWMSIGFLRYSKNDEQ